MQVIYIIFDKLYKHTLFLFFALNAHILKIPGIKLIKNGFTNDKPKLIILSLIRYIWLFIYIPQKQVI